ncbi:bifunctional GNAT family N-acetyltransferase/carbon-nitrogen hydrolase family protein [Oligoflexus tunisiensis]|uniref:bifunctional GNAT family N-acetyltransferase/carbon-nitrogen hydrolase family protein n=1 Tax=Oligoflexus tunisiensis TaxID=708132 RepID=UPI000B2ACC3E|nr:bifunctional GNAT family N-acetyltransferase/carbon-nitrogen hydrolase family protein [Oligoflexus tunisiensis]
MEQDVFSARLMVRLLTKADVEAIQDLQKRCYGGMAPWDREQIESQIDIFPEGQIAVELDGELVGTSSSLIVDEEDYGSWHSYKDVSDNGYIRNHDPAGDTLYGIDIAVDPSSRGMRFARRLYEARKEFAVKHNLRAIMIAGRIPGYHEHAKNMSPEEYVKKVITKDIKDPVLTAQLANGFAIRMVLRNYLPSDKESCGHAVCMEWLNPEHHPDKDTVAVREIRVAAVQYQMRNIKTFEDFAQQCEFFIDTASEYRMDFLLFPELLTNQLQPLVPGTRPGLAARRLHEFTDQYIDFFRHMAMKHNINIIGGSHLTVENEKLYNISYLFRRDGSVAKQYKLHITPSESRWWGVGPGKSVEVFETDRGKIAILICYDVEFPELARIAAAKGANIIFIPFNTDLRSGYMRVRTCAAARCIENGVYAVLAGSIGNLPFVDGADIHYGQACILTPSDVAFARDGIAEEATPNVETMVVSELNIETLRKNRRMGSVRPWLDRRTDIYSVTWKEADEKKHI